MPDDAPAIRARQTVQRRMLGTIYLPAQLPKPNAPIVQRYSDGVTVTAPRYVIHPEDRTAEFSGGVVVTYGPTTVTADRLFYHDDPADAYGEAIGNVTLVDPDGTIKASDLIYHFQKRRGAGHNVDVRVFTLHLTAKSIEVSPDLWTLTEVKGTGCDERFPLYSVATPRLEIRPGEGIRAIHPRLSILGQKLPALPTQNLSFNGGGGSVNLPYPTYRSDLKWGVNWTNELPLGANTALQTRYAVFQRSLPFYNGTLLHSFEPGRDPEPIRSEIGDRLTFGYFDTVQQRDPAGERTYLTTPRLQIGVSSTWGADARDTTSSSDKINKPIEGLAEASGQLGGFGILGIARAQEVRVGDQSTLQRLILEGDLLSPSLDLGSLSLFARADAAEYVGNHRYGWLRGQVGGALSLTRDIRVGASYSAAQAHGTPDFAYDAPLRFREFALRGDLDFDTTQARVLLKFDPSTGQLFDRELYFSQVVGCIEPYLVYRERPRKFFIGIKLPLYRVFDRVRKDLEQRHVISGGSE